MISLRDHKMLTALDPNRPGNRFRDQRFLLFKDLVNRIVPQKACVRILDIGGKPEYWADRLDTIGRSCKVLVVNLGEQPPSLDERVDVADGDARRLPFEDDSFDVVHSNSVIEHVGRWHDMRAMANEVHRVAKCHFVQTPNFWFPVEPHCRQFFYHWLPRPWRLRMVMSRKLGFWPKATNRDMGMAYVDMAVMLDKGSFVDLFPDSRIHEEKFFGLTKSFVAVKDGVGGATNTYR